jgi:hypothetical protein
MAAGRIGQIQDAIYNELVSGGTKKKIADREASKLAREWYEKGFSNEFEGHGVDSLKQKIYYKLRTKSRVFNYGTEVRKKLSNKFKQSSIGIGKGIKWGMRGMKLFSYAGIASLAWGIASAVGEPIGRGIISTANETLKSYEERFMPEVGGKLRLSYLTRGSATERQRAIEAISKANINGRSAFGQESLYLHQ